MRRDPGWRTHATTGRARLSRSTGIALGLALGLLQFGLFAWIGQALMGAVLGVLVVGLITLLPEQKPRLAEGDPWLAALRGLPSSETLEIEPSGRARGTLRPASPAEAMTVKADSVAKAATKAATWAKAEGATGHPIELDQGITAANRGAVGFSYWTRIAVGSRLPERLVIRPGLELRSGLGDPDFDRFVFMAGPRADWLQWWLDPPARRSLEHLVSNWKGTLDGGWFKVTVPEPTVSSAELQRWIDQVRAMVVLLEGALEASDAEYEAKLLERVLEDPVPGVRLHAFRLLARLRRARHEGLPQAVVELVGTAPIALRLEIFGDLDDRAARAQLRALLSGAEWYVFLMERAGRRTRRGAHPGWERAQQLLREELEEQSLAALAARWRGARETFDAWWFAERPLWLLPLLGEVGDRAVLEHLEAEAAPATEATRSRIRRRLGIALGGGLSVVDVAAEGALTVLEGAASGGLSELERRGRLARQVEGEPEAVEGEPEAVVGRERRRE